MLSKAQMVAVRRAIEMTYDGKCTVTEHHKVKRDNGSTGFKDVIVNTNVPCKLSFSSVVNTRGGETADLVVQSAKVLLAPEIVIRPGSRLTISQNGVTTEYGNSGEPALYDTHQEVGIVLFRGWA